MPASRYGDWNKYEWGREQLASYMQTLTGEGGISVQDGTGSTHIATKSVRLPVGTPHAPGTAAHESAHITETDNDAWHHPVILAGGQAYSMLLNSLEDSRMERVYWRKYPGMRAQWQHDIDAYAPVILQEDWLMQALKFMCLETTGYTLPDRSEMAPKTRKMLKAFDATGVKYKARNADNTMDLVPLVPIIGRIFDEYKPKPPEPKPPQPPQPPVPEGATGESQDDRDHEGEPGEPNPFLDDQPQDASQDAAGQPSEGQDGQAGQETTSDTPQGHTDDVGDGECALCDAIEAGESAPVRAPQKYDADQAGHEARAQQKAMSEATPDNTGHGHADNVDGYDEATGGPSANRLLERASKLAQRAERMDEARNVREREDAKADDDTVRKPAAAPTKTGEAVDEDMPKAAEEFVDTDKLLENKRLDRYGRSQNAIPINLNSLLPTSASGGLGYGSYTAMLADGRKPDYRSVDAPNQEVSVAATGQYLGRQMRVWLQSQDRSAMRDHERFGLFDPRRSYAMGAGKFDVYKNPPKFKPTLPVVCLSVDMSSSMVPYGRQGPMDPSGSACHATFATWLLARALTVLRIPFEVTGFGGSSNVWMLKEFHKPYDETAVRALSNIAHMASGGTPAAEGLAFAYARSLTRPESRKVIIQITDAGVAHNTKNVATALRKAGVTIIGIGIGTDDTRTRMFYGDGFAVDTAQALPGRMVALLRRLTLEGKLR